MCVRCKCCYITSRNFCTLILLYICLYSDRNYSAAYPQFCPNSHSKIPTKTILYIYYLIVLISSLLHIYYISYILFSFAPDIYWNNISIVIVIRWRRKVSRAPCPSANSPVVAPPSCATICTLIPTRGISFVCTRPDATIVASRRCRSRGKNLFQLFHRFFFISSLLFSFSRAFDWNLK